MIDFIWPKLKESVLSRAPVGTTVRVEFEEPTSATVVVDVVQCPWDPRGPDA